MVRLQPVLVLIFTKYVLFNWILFSLSYCLKLLKLQLTAKINNFKKKQQKKNNNLIISLHDNSRNKYANLIETTT